MARRAALGNRIDANADDGANEAQDYADPDHYLSPNAPLVVDDPGAALVDPSIWQPLDLANAVTQNGIPTGGGVRGYIGAQWGGVRPFPMTPPGGIHIQPDDLDGRRIGHEIGLAAVAKARELYDGTITIPRAATAAARDRR